jgi:hypothetical protein
LGLSVLDQFHSEVKFIERLLLGARRIGQDPDDEDDPARSSLGRCLEMFPGRGLTVASTQSPSGSATGIVTETPSYVG